MIRSVINFYNNHLSLWVVFFAIIAYLFPSDFVRIKPYINFFFAVTMFGIGLVITEEDYKNIIKTPFIILFGNLCQFTIMPLLALLTASIFNLPNEFTIGLILTGSAPGAMTSNIITYLSHGDTAYSVSLTALATLLCPILTPLLTFLLAGKITPVPFGSMFLTIIYTVVVPLIIGFVVRKYFTDFVNKITEIPPAISVTSIIIICSYVVAANKTNLGKATVIIFIAVISHNFVGMILGYYAGAVGRLDFKRKKTLSIEIGMQNAGLGVVLALQHFSAEVAIPGVIFTIWCIISASILINFWIFLEKRENSRKI
ncbi:MAG: bile acid:sodium symporter family protein [Spirochaetota bacterium]|nr:bile acid:sodium symporter family protein [Spirochaetota bacterium]